MAPNVETIDHVVIRFAGDSGDGMRLTGTQFTNTSAIQGNDLMTFPDSPLRSVLLQVRPVFLDSRRTSQAGHPHSR